MGEGQLLIFALDFSYTYNYIGSVAIADGQYVADNGYVMTHNGFGGYGHTMSYIYLDEGIVRYVDYSIEEQVIRVDVTSDNFLQIELNQQFENLAAGVIYTGASVFGILLF